VSPRYLRVDKVHVSNEFISCSQLLTALPMGLYINVLVIVSKLAYCLTIIHHRGVTSLYQFIPHYTQQKVNRQSCRRSRTQVKAYQIQDRYKPRSCSWQNRNAKGKIRNGFSIFKIWLSGNDILLDGRVYYGDKRSQRWQWQWFSGSEGSFLGWLVVISNGIFLHLIAKYVTANLNTSDEKT